jgi:hypothetical protein
MKIMSFQPHQPILEQSYIALHPCETQMQLGHSVTELQRQSNRFALLGLRYLRCLCNLIPELVLLAAL